VVHIPRNLGGGETSLTESSSDRLGSKAESYSVDWLKIRLSCGRIAIRV
jgi:hypothetical protein